MLTLLDRLLIATVGRQMPSSTCFLIEILNLEKISGYLLQNVLKFVTSLSYKKPCLTSCSHHICDLFQLVEMYEPRRLVC